MTLQITTIPVGLIGENCYILTNTESKEAYLLDPGADTDNILTYIKQLGAKPRAIILTHGHVDHLGAVPDMVAKFSIPVWVHPKDCALYSSPKNCFMPWLPLVKNLPTPVDLFPKIEGITPRILHTPGHTPGGVCFYYPKEKVIFTGDTLFRNTYGRTDFEGGSFEQIKDSISNVLFSLDGDIKVYPGHHDPTTIKQEMDHNLF